jgi:hypothetical protein
VAHAPDEFDRLLGDGRGITDARVLLARLSSAERELAGATTELERVYSEKDELAHGRQLLHDRIAGLEDAVEDAAVELASCQCDHDHARYIAVAAGLGDPFIRGEPEHQGVWTPGRPYISGQHVYDPQTGACYQARCLGVVAGKHPRQSKLWYRCKGAPCPELVELSMDPHPAASGYALRQERSWWDREKKRWKLKDLSREHLLGVIKYLEDNIVRLYADDSAQLPMRVPCPPNAYFSTGGHSSQYAWLQDTPLMRALLAEKRRRRIRRSRGRASEVWEWGDKHAS